MSSIDIHLICLICLHLLAPFASSSCKINWFTLSQLLQKSISIHVFVPFGYLPDRFWILFSCNKYPTFACNANLLLVSQCRICTFSTWTFQFLLLMIITVPSLVLITVCLVCLFCIEAPSVDGSIQLVSRPEQRLTTRELAVFSR